MDKIKIDSRVLRERLGYQFEDLELLRRALSHRSMGADNNERLEFLGDSILNFVIGSEIYQRFPQASEGELTRLRAQLVKGETLTAIAKTMQLGEHVLLGAAERKSGGHQRSSILADVLEAIVAAVYLDSDIQQVRERVCVWFAEYLQRFDPTQLQKDAKTTLQEQLQGKGQPLPEYTQLSVSGEPHQQWFTVSCIVEGLAEPVQGEGTTRRQAEQQAAQAVLELLKRGSE